MESFSLAWAAQAMHAQIQGKRAGQITEICLDTRRLTPGCLFFALAGENTDGHHYVLQALARGAAAAVVSSPIESENGSLLQVPDTLVALGDLAQAYRKQFPAKVIGVTGSVGKTSTKEMIAAALRTGYRTLSSEKNHNNEIGVPLTLFRLNRAHQIAVIEMGMRGKGQIDRLAEIAQPDAGIITNIGSSHAELLGSRGAIARAKAELFARLPVDGIAILPANDRYAATLRKHIPAGCQIVTFAFSRTTGADISASPRTLRIHPNGSTSFQVRVTGEKQRYQVKLQAVGTHHVKNALAALATSYAYGLALPQCIAALENWTGAEGRMVVRCTEAGLTILDDCYNAGPESMLSALQTLGKMRAGGVAVLGDMRELGALAHAAHRRLGQQISAAQIRLLVTVGPLAGEIADAVEADNRAHVTAAPAIQRFPSAESCAVAIPSLVTAGDTVLIKGSRAMQMESIVQALSGGESAVRHD